VKRKGLFTLALAFLALTFLRYGTESDHILEPRPSSEEPKSNPFFQIDDRDTPSQDEGFLPPFREEDEIEYTSENDPNGILQAEYDFQSSARLKRCAGNINCKNHSDALFWLAALDLSDAGFDQRDDESAIEFRKRKSVGYYDLDSDKFKTGFELMKQAYRTGSIEAANELGLLYLEEKQLKDFGKAEPYLRFAHDAGDTMGSYNLARLFREVNPNDYHTPLRYLEVMAENPSVEGEEIFYFLALEAFGSDSERDMAIQAIQNYGENEVDYRRNRFIEHFNPSAR